MKNSQLRLVAIQLALIALFALAVIVFSNVRQAFGVTLPSGTALFETSLQDRISSTDSSMSLVSATTRGGGTLSGFQCFTIDEGTTVAEFVCGTLSGTAVSSLERGLDPLTGTSTVAALKFAHRKGADVKITDFPLIQRLRNQANGIESFPNILKYASALTPTVGDYDIPTWDYVKTYADGLSFAGTSNADTVTKGIVQLGTARQAASSTATGSTGAAEVLKASYATDTPQNCSTAATGGCVVMSDLTGHLKQAWLDLTATFSPSGIWNFLANVGVGTSSPYAALSVVSSKPAVFSTIYATSTATGNATSTFDGNVRIGNNASTTNLTISGKCNGCTVPTIVSSSSGVSSPTSGQHLGASASCSGTQQLSGGGIRISATSLALFDSYPSSATTWSVDTVCTSGTCSGVSVTAYAICINP